MMKLKDLTDKKSYKFSGIALAVAGIGLSAWGFLEYQIVSADVAVASKSDFGTALIVTGAIMIIGSIITFAYLVFSDFV